MLLLLLYLQLKNLFNFHTFFLEYCTVQSYYLPSNLYNYQCQSHNSWPRLSLLVHQRMARCSTYMVAFESNNLWSIKQYMFCWIIRIVFTGMCLFSVRIYCFISTEKLRCYMHFCTLNIKLIEYISCSRKSILFLPLWSFRSSCQITLRKNRVLPLQSRMFQYGLLSFL